MKVILRTNHPVATESADHQYPLGTAKDSFRWPPFTKKLIALYGGNPIKVLDLGCAGGGFVKEVLDFGHFAIGLEGSDYSLRHKRAEWSSIPDHLLTCDCSKPFELFFEKGEQREPAYFDVVTAWEVLEHFTEEQLSTLLENTIHHLDPDRGLFVASIHLHSCLIDGVEYHPTVRPEWWWRDLLRANGFYLLDRALEHFDEDWVRGPRQNTPGSFHAVASLAHNSWIARQVDRIATGTFPHGRLQRVELKQLTRALQEGLASVEKERDDLRAQLEELRTERAALLEANQSLRNKQTRLETFLQDLDTALTRKFCNSLALGQPFLQLMCVHAILAVQECRQRGLHGVAFYGTGKHSTLLLPLWLSLGGPPVRAFLTSQPKTQLFKGVPVIPAGSPLPSFIDAVVPSSHRYEKQMRRAFLKHYSHLAWIPFWTRMTTSKLGADHD